LATTAPGAVGSDGLGPFVAFGEQVASAWADSFMARFPLKITEALLDGASERVVLGGDVVYQGWEQVDAAELELIVDGLVRTHVHAQSGREITIRYGWPGDVVGLPALVLAALDGEQGRNRWELYGVHRLHAEALRDTSLLKLPAAPFVQLAQSDASVAFTVASCMARLTVETEQMLEDGLFLSIRARVARHLLDLAVWRDGALVVAEGHREIADAIGSVREVVSRTLVRLRDERVVERRETETVLLDPAALHAIAAAG
jgi:CRP-like cAMP-binding protein